VHEYPYPVGSTTLISGCPVGDRSLGEKLDTAVISARGLNA